MRAQGVAIAVAAALVVVGCGEDDFENDPRPPVTMELTGVIQEDRVSISPSRKLGAGPFVITISNQTDAEHTLTLEGESLTREAGPVEPLDTTTLRGTLTEGTYEVRAGSERAVPREIRPAVLEIGPERPDSNNTLMLP